MNTDTILIIIGLVVISLLISGFIVLLDYVSKRKTLIIEKIGSYHCIDEYHFYGKVPKWIKRHFASLVERMTDGETIVYGPHYDIIVTMNNNGQELDGNIYKRWHK